MHSCSPVLCELDRRNVFEAMFLSAPSACLFGRQVQGTACAFLGTVRRAPAIINYQYPVKMVGHYRPFIQFYFISDFGGFYPFVGNDWPDDI